MYCIKLQQKYLNHKHTLSSTVLECPWNNSFTSFKTIVNVLAQELMNFDPEGTSQFGGKFFLKSEVP